MCGDAFSFFGSQERIQPQVTLISGYLCSETIKHGNVKLQNILLLEDYQRPKLDEFSDAPNIDDAKGGSTNCHTAPEFLLSVETSAASDI